MSTQAITSQDRLMRLHRSLAFLFALALLSTASVGRAQVALATPDRAAIVELLAQMSATALRAWNSKNASLLVPDSAVLDTRTPQGATLTAAQLRADVQRRMDMTARVDTLVEVLDSVRVIKPDSMLAYSTQRFVRVIRLPDGAERQRFSTIIHERVIVRRAGQWQSTAQLREIAPRAWWAGDVAPAPVEAAALATVRRALEARYAENEAGFFARDADRVMRLRHPDFHTIAPDGAVSTREQIYQRTRAFIGRIERFDSLTETITALTLAGDTAHAVVLQRTVRQQRFPDGLLHEVRTSVVQRESWVRTAEGWLFWRVDQIQPGVTLIDGRPVP